MAHKSNDTWSPEMAQEYLLGSYGAGRKKGMDAVLAALSRLGEPQEKIPIIHVAGTNGKGSFCAMMGAVLAAAGFCVGSFTSPHIEVFNERFTINGEMISDADFARHLGRLAEISREMFGEGDGFSYFEYLTMLAFCYFHEQSVDFLLLEVGIGGKNDCTNVIKSPVLSAIMAIGFDHMEILGNDLETIAGEKGGIIKKGRPVAIYDDVPQVSAVFKRISAEKGVKIYESGAVDLKGLEIGLLGGHQQKNAAVVVAACHALQDLGFGISEADISEGLAKARHMGRMEIFGNVILEGAHNLQGAQAAADNMRQMYEGREITVIMGMMADKELGKIVNTLAHIASKIIFTKPHYDFRAANPKDLADCLQGFENDVFIEDNCIDALNLAQKTAASDGMILVIGSLYLVGDIRAHIRKGDMG